MKKKHTRGRMHTYFGSGILVKRHISADFFFSLSSELFSFLHLPSLRFFSLFRDALFRRGRTRGDRRRAQGVAERAV